MYATHGAPRPEKWAVGTTGREVAFDTSAMHLRITNPAGNAVRLYFTEEAFDADAGLVAAAEGARWEEVAAGAIWDGPAYANRIWLRAAAGTQVVTVTPFAKLA